MEGPAAFKRERTDTLHVTDDTALALHLVGYLNGKPAAG
jgi:hypothetical protein